MKQRLKPSVLQRIKKDEPLIFQIAVALNRTFRTVQRWIRENDEMLASKAVLDIIRTHYQYGKEELLTDTVAEHKAVA